MTALIVLKPHKKFQRAHRSAYMCFEFLKFGLEMPFLHILLSKINVWTRYDLIRCPFSRYYDKPVRAISFSKLDNSAVSICRRPNYRTGSIYRLYSRGKQSEHTPFWRGLTPSMYRGLTQTMFGVRPRQCTGSHPVNVPQLTRLVKVHCTRN